jgi:hypothetical protein
VTGLTLAAPGSSVVENPARFDWYAATIREEPRIVLDRLAHGLGGEVVNGNPKQGYARGDFIVKDGSTVATIYSGGRNGHPHAFSSSDDTDPFVPLVRSIWGGRHHVTRFDSCIDFDGPDSWDTLYAICEKFVLEYGDDAHRLAVSQHGDWLRLEAGRTFTIGSPKSAVRLNLYEKGKERIGKSLDGGVGISPDLVRFEVRVRPEGDSRLQAATGDPLAGFGYARWSQELLEAVTGAGVDRVHVKARRESDHDRAMFWLLSSYGNHIMEEARILGEGDTDRGFELLGLALQRRLGLLEDGRQDVTDSSPFMSDATAREYAAYSDRTRKRPFLDDSAPTPF